MDWDSRDNNNECEGFFLEEESSSDSSNDFLEEDFASEEIDAREDEK